MLFIPLPFVITLLFLLLLGRVLRDGGVASMRRPFTILIAGYALLSFIIGLRWGYGLTGLVPVMSLLAVCLPPLSWIAFRGIAGRTPSAARDLVHALPAVLVLLQIALWPELIDWVVILVQAGYGLALLLLAMRGSDALAGATLEEAATAHRMMILVGVLLVLSAATDFAISLDFIFASGVHATRVVTAANLAGLLGFGLAAAVAGRSQPVESSPDDEQFAVAGPSAEDQDIAGKIADLVRSQHLYRDPDLTLNRLARKALIPARRISVAINRTTGESVSRFINGHRITEACRLLDETDQPVTAIMFEAGFQTKSNFNREFRQRTGKSPAEWRGRVSGAAPTSP